MNDSEKRKREKERKILVFNSVMMQNISSILSIYHTLDEVYNIYAEFHPSVVNRDGLLCSIYDFTFFLQSKNYVFLAIICDNQSSTRDNHLLPILDRLCLFTFFLRHHSCTTTNCAHLIIIEIIFLVQNILQILKLSIFFKGQQISQILKLSIFFKSQQKVLI